MSKFSIILIAMSFQCTTSIEHDEVVQVLTRFFVRKHVQTVTADTCWQSGEFDCMVTNIFHVLSTSIIAVLEGMYGCILNTETQQSFWQLYSFITTNVNSLIINTISWNKVNIFFRIGLFKCQTKSKHFENSTHISYVQDVPDLFD